MTTDISKVSRVISENIQRLMNERNLNNKELAEILDVSESTVGKWLLRKSIPRMGPIEKMANYFGVDKSDILEDKSLLPSNMFPLHKAKMLPVLGPTPIPCGDPNLIFDTDHIDEWIVADSAVKANFCLRVSGDSMIGAGIQDGDVAFIRKQETVEAGEIAAVLLPESHEATLKRVYIKENYVLLQPDNPAYEPIVVKEDVIILGKLIGIYHDME